MHYSALVAPINVKSWAVVDGVQLGYPSAKIIAGELLYGFSIADSDAILVAGLQTLSAPTGLKYDSAEDALVWDAVDNATEYTYEYQSSQDAEPTSSTITDAYISNPNIGALTTAYKYRVKATDGDDYRDSSYSNWFVTYKHDTPANLTVNYDNGTIHMTVNDRAFRNMSENVPSEIPIVFYGAGLNEYRRYLPLLNQNDGYVGDIDISEIKTAYPDGVRYNIKAERISVDNEYYVADSDAAENIYIGPVTPMPVPTDISVDLSTMTVSWTNPDPSGQKIIMLHVNTDENGDDIRGTTVIGYPFTQSDSTATSYTFENASALIAALSDGCYWYVQMKNLSVDITHSASPWTEKVVQQYTV